MYDAITIEVINGSTVVTLSTGSSLTKHIVVEGRDYTAHVNGVRLSSDPNNAELNYLFIDLALLTDKFGCANGFELSNKFVEMGAFRKAVISAALTTDIALPQPMIKKRRIRLFPIVDDEGYRIKLDTITNKRYNAEDILNMYYPDDYYKERLEIFFNSFGDRKWLSMPDLQLELVMVKNKHKRGKRGDDYVNTLVHPRDLFHNTKDIYNGGVPQMKTVWKINPNINTFGDSVENNVLNKKNNPSLVVELDVRDFFKIHRTIAVLEYPVFFSNELNLVSGIKIVKVRNIGLIKSVSNKVRRRNTVLFFRLSCGVPATEKNGIFQKRLFSSLSLPVYIKPKISIFYQDIYDTTSQYDDIMYGHTLTIGR